MKKRFHQSIFLLFCLLVTLFIPITKSDVDDQIHYLTNICSQHPIKLPPRNTYNSTLTTLLNYLSSNATTDPNGFYTTSVYDHTINNTIYAYFLCRGDLDNNTCHTCVSAAVARKSICGQSKWGVIYYDKCMIKYSNETLHGVLALKPIYDDQNNVAVASNRDDFAKLLGNTFHKLASHVAKDRTGRKYASTSVSFTALTTVYVLVQCTPDLSVSDCYICLTNAIGKIQAVRVGEKFFTPSCNIRYEIYPFFGSMGYLLPFSPPGMKP